MFNFLERNYGAIVPQTYISPTDIEIIYNIPDLDFTDAGVRKPFDDWYRDEVLDVITHHVKFGYEEFFGFIDLTTLMETKFTEYISEEFLAHDLVWYLVDYLDMKTMWKLENGRLWLTIEL